jgi:hypothetical protein
MKTIVWTGSGALAMVAKVIVQAEPGVLSLLPALPALPDQTERGTVQLGRCQRPVYGRALVY